MADGCATPDLRQIPDMMVTRDRFPVVDWERLRTMAESSGADLHRFWCEAQRQWLRELGSVLGPLVQFRESANLMLLLQCSADPDWIVDAAERIRSQILATLEGAQPVSDPGKLPIIVFNGDAPLRQYARVYGSPGGGRGLQAIGMCIDEGTVHVVLAGLSAFQVKFPHELAHAILAPCRVPRWVDEGYALWVEHTIGKRLRHRPGTVEKLEHRALWSRRGIEGFWSGEAFAYANGAETVLAAYDLAALLIRHVHEFYPTQFGRFVAGSRREDHGAAAAKEHLEMSLGQLASVVLGPGTWHGE